MKRMAAPLGEDKKTTSTSTSSPSSRKQMWWLPTGKLLTLLIFNKINYRTHQPQSTGYIEDLADGECGYRGCPAAFAKCNYVREISVTAQHAFTVRWARRGCSFFTISSSVVLPGTINVFSTWSPFSVPCCICVTLFGWWGGGGVRKWSWWGCSLCACQKKAVADRATTMTSWKLCPPTGGGRDDGRTFSSRRVCCSVWVWKIVCQMNVMLQLEA